MDEFHHCIKDDVVTQWTLELIHPVYKFDNKITHVMDHWIDCLLGGFVSDFFVHQFVFYSEVERRFFKGPIGKFMSSLKLLLKMLLCEKGCICEHTT